MNTQHERIGKLVAKMKADNPELIALFLDQKLDDAALVERLKENISTTMQQQYPVAWAYYSAQEQTEQEYYKLMSTSMAYLRMMDYLDHEGESFVDGNLHGEAVVSSPISLLRGVLLGSVDTVNLDFLEDMTHLMAQLSGVEEREIPSRNQVQQWMDRHPSGLDHEVIAFRAKNKERIVELLIKRIEEQKNKKTFYHFSESMSYEQKRKQVLAWWKEDRFHLRFAVRSAEESNRYLDYSLDEKTLQIMIDAQNK